jgi:hypothetical protein
LSLRLEEIFRNSAVTESRDIPPLPVSNMKFKESGKASTWALKRIIPPVSKRNGKLVIFRIGGSTNSSWACKGWPA